MQPDDDAPSLVNRATLLAYMRWAGTICVCEVMQRFCTGQEDACSIMAMLEREGWVDPCPDKRCAISPAAWKARQTTEVRKPV